MLIDNDGKIVTKSDPTTELAETTSIIQTPAKNLSSKIDSILRSIENLTEKKLRIEFEIKKQKKESSSQERRTKESSKFKSKTTQNLS
jgi:hypothetical protein